MPWIFGSFLVIPCALTSCHLVIRKQDSMIRALRLNRCVTGRISRDDGHAVRGVSACKRWHPLASRRRHEKSSL